MTLPMVSLIKLIKSLSLFIFLSVYNLYQLINDYIYIEPAAIEEESNDELLLEIRLKYDADGRRPSEGGVKITIPNNQERYSFNSDQIIQIVPLLIDNQGAVLNLLPRLTNNFHLKYCRYSKEDMEALHQQCGVFYSKTIAEGIRAAFLDEEK